MNLEEWLIDVSFGNDPPCFVPLERETGNIVFGLNMIQDRSPGKLVGVIHCGGQKKAEEWVEKNPDWVERFSPVPNGSEVRG